MWQTLFFIPRQVGGVPLFGFGLLLAAWAVFSVVLLAWLIRRQGFDAEVRGYLPILLLVGAAIAFLLPHLAGPRGLPIRGYGAMLVVAISVGSSLVVHRAGQVGVDADTIFSLSFWVFLCGIAGARLFYVVEYWQQFQSPTFGQTLGRLLNIAQGGLVIYGGILGGAIALLVLIRVHRLPALPLLDAIAAPAILGLAIGRIGCLLNGCCFGGPCDLPWAVTFPAGSPPYLSQLQRGQLYLQGLQLKGGFRDPPVVEAVEAHSAAAAAGLRPGERVVAVNGTPVRSVGQAYAELMDVRPSDKTIHVATAGRAAPVSWRWKPERSLPIHPTQLYSTLNGSVLFLFLWAYFPYRRRDGEVAALLMTLYPVTRFLLEVIRTDEPPLLGTGLTVSQMVSLLLLAAAAILWSYLLVSPRQVTQPHGAAA